MATSITVSGKTLYITPTGFRIGAKGKVVRPGDFYATLPKGERRRIRKEAFAKGFVAHATA